MPTLLKQNKLVTEIPFLEFASSFFKISDEFVVRMFVVSKMVLCIADNPYVPDESTFEYEKNTKIVSNFSPLQLTHRIWQGLF